MRIMAIDYGDTRTGIAICDKLEMLASPYTVITEVKYLALATKIMDIAVKENIEEIVLGNPMHMNGSEGIRSNKSKQLQGLLKRKLKVPVILLDERQTTVSAHNILSENNVKGQKRKDIIDAVAATIILETYLAKKKNGIVME